MTYWKYAGIIVLMIFVPVFVGAMKPTVLEPALETARTFLRGHVPEASAFKIHAIVMACYTFMVGGVVGLFTTRRPALEIIGLALVISYSGVLVDFMFGEFSINKMYISSIIFLSVSFGMLLVKGIFNKLTSVSI